MKLREMLNTINSDTPIRIFVGCMTIFNGKRSEASEKEWNLKVLPYMDCKVFNSCAINGTVVMVI